MRADHAVRHNAAVGALVGLAVGDIVSQLNVMPPAMAATMAVLPTWGCTAERCFRNGERLLSQQPVDMMLSPTDVVAPAIALADPDASPPLLVDPDAVLVCSLIRAALAGALSLDEIDATQPATQIAIDAVVTSSSFGEALTHSPKASMPLTGALAGLRWGPAAIPAAWATLASGPVGSHNYGLRQLRRLAERLMQQDAPVPPEPRRALGPREVAPGLWLSNLHAVPWFLAEHPEGAVISLCPTTGTFDHHLLRREFALHDAAGSKVNPLLSTTVDEVLATISAFRDEGRDVLVHCHHGASRTGLVLRAWLVAELGLSADDATAEAQVRWPKTSTWNNAFSSEIMRRARS